MTSHKIVTREQWAAAREELLAREKEHTRLGDELARQRRELPWLRVEKDYRFDTDDGTRTLAELFDGRNQLLAYHFMFGPSYAAGCPTCSSIADSVNGVLPHLNARDVTILFVSQAPLETLQAVSGRWAGASPGCRRPTVSSTSISVSQAARSRRASGRADARATAADRRPQREGDRHRRRRLPDQEFRFQRVRSGRQGCLPDLFGRRPRGRVPDGLLRDPRPGTERPRRGRWVPAVDPPPRRIRQPVTRLGGQ